ncbi:MAG: Nif3-like dinuclear metal center hexameric protein, partial [Desulfonatronovibrio sp.]
TTTEGLLREVILPSDKIEEFLLEIKKNVWPFFYMVTEKPEYDQVSGLGFTGRLSQSMPFETFLSKLKDILGIAHISMVGEPSDMIQNVACCPGSGGDMASKAFNMGADIYITGDLKYHQAQDLALKGAVLDVGHFILEEKMMFEWYNELKQSLKEIELIFIEGKSPFNIL